MTTTPKGTKKKTPARFRTTVGAYRQEDLEAMSVADLLLLTDFAQDRFDEHLDSHDFGQQCDVCDYFELLTGAAFEVSYRKRKEEEDDR